MDVTSTSCRIQTLIVQDKNFVFTIFSCTMVLLIFLNLSLISSPIIGTFTSLVYILINGIFLGSAFFKDTENLYVKFMLGTLTLTMLLATIAWVGVVAVNIDVIRTTIVLVTVTILCSLLNTHYKRKSARSRNEHDSTVPSSSEENVSHKHNIKLVPSRLLQLIYLFMVALSFYLLSLSRTSEVHTVWNFMHPAFLPVFFATTFVLITIVLSSEKASHKLALISLHSILMNSLFVIIFPASGDLGGQQTVLGNARLAYDNISQGFLVSAESPFIIPHMFMEGFQIPLTVVFARMFAVDILWTHVLFVPVIWGIFAPLAAFMIPQVLGLSEKVSTLSSMLLLLFPLTVVWGSISVPNSFGYITAFWSFYFILKYLSSAKEGFPFFASAFCLISFLVHFLAGTLSFIFLIFALSLRRYEKEKSHSLGSARTFLAMSFLFSTSLLPLSLPFVRLFTRMHPYFSMYKLNGVSLEEVIQLTIFGEFINFSIGAALVYGVGKIVGLFAIIYFLTKSLRNRNGKAFHLCTVFISACFLMLLLDYRILRLLLVNPPFDEERLWLFQNFLTLPFVAVIIYRFATFLRGGWSKKLHTSNSPLHTALSKKRRFTTIIVYVLLLTTISGFTTSAVYYGYPHYGPLQTTSYEMEAAKYIHENTEGRYIVICDLWFIYAGEILYGVYNPHAFYFSHWDPQGTKLFMDMKGNPSIDTMVTAIDTEYNNATTVYFVIEKPRLGEEQYNRIKSKATQNNLDILPLPKRVSHYQDEEKLTIFYYTHA
jgi:hypothetical protein